MTMAFGEPSSTDAWPRRLASGVRPIWGICRWNLRLTFRQKVFWLLAGLGALHFLLNFAIIYAKAQLTVTQPAFARFLDQFLVTGTGKAYRDFLQLQARAVTLLLAHAGAVLLAGDYRAGGVIFYLARPVSKAQYLAGKLLCLMILVALLTLLPALVLYGEYGIYSPDLSYWSENPRVFFAIIGFSLLAMTFPPLLLLAVGIWCQRITPMLTTWLSLAVVLPLNATLLAAVFRRSEFRLLDLWFCMGRLGNWMFGIPPAPSDRWLIGGAAGVLAGVAGVAAAVVAWKLRAVEVIR